jgi:hypothetical protein
VYRTVAVSGLALLTVVGCGSTPDDSDEFHFTEADMAGAVVGTWTGTWTVPATATESMTLKIARMPLAASNPGCGSRTYSAGAPERGPLCIITSDMGVSATLKVNDPTFASTYLTGDFSVVGANFAQGQLNVRSENSDLEIVATWAAGRWESCRAGHIGAGDVAACTIDKRP